MRIIARRTLQEFAASCVGQHDHAALSHALDTWFHEVRQAVWRNSADVRRTYAHTSIISSERIVFNIKGNDYRLVVAIDYRYATVWIKWIGTHADYDTIDARTIEYDP